MNLTWLEQTLVVGYGVIVAICLIRHFIWGWAMRATPFLAPGRVDWPTGQAPRVSILVPAKDEEKGIQACLESLLEQDYPNFEIWVVNDRSVDSTAQIVEEVAKKDPRVNLLSIKHLPEGWTGKTHALQQLQAHVRGEWLLFVDADTRQHPTSLSISIQDSLRNKTDMLSVMPALDMKSFWERVVQPFAAMCLMILYPLPRVNDPKRKEMGFANGQFILVRRSAYDAIGQHTLVRDKFVEDVHLGRLIREKGLSLRVAMAPDLVSVRMYASLTEIIRGWARILYSGVDMRPGKLWMIQALILVFSVLAYVVLGVTGALILAGHATSFVWIMFWLAVAHEVLQETMFARIYRTTRSRLDYLVFRPLAVGVMLYVVGKAIGMCRTHAVVWRGTTYDARLQKTGP
ncbi:glycosyltransferase family 2 protein [bacterium]|nr:glycosyltransferase family 2 protein [bacterium]